MYGWSPQSIRMFGSIYYKKTIKVISQSVCAAVALEHCQHVVLYCVGQEIWLFCPHSAFLNAWMCGCVFILSL